MTTETTAATATKPAAAPAAGTGLAHAGRIGWERGKIEVKEFFRQRESVVFTIAFPVILLLVFSTVFSYTIDGTGIAFARYFVPGILAVGLFGVAFQTVAIQIAVERDKGTLKRLEGTPMPPSSYFIGKIIMVLVLILLESALLLVIASILGKVSLPTSPERWLTFLWVTLLGTAAGTMLGIAFSSIPRTGKAAPAVVTPVALLLQFVSGVYFVFTQVNPTVQVIGSLFPLKWIAQGYRSVLLPDSLARLEPTGTWEHGKTALVLAAWTLGGLFLALRTFRWRSRADS